MPNWCMHSVSISGPPQELIKLYVKAHDLESILLLLEPTQEELNDHNLFQERFGTSKYEVDLYFEMLFLKEPFEILLFLHFDTAWSPAENFFLGLSALYPKCSFEVQYLEPGMYFGGSFIAQNGEFQEYVEYDDDEMALAIQNI